MIQGPIWWRANTKRTSHETSTRTPSHAQPGTAASRLRTEADLAEPRRELRDVRDASLRRRFGHTPEDRVLDLLAAGRELERCHVAVCGLAEVVLALDVRTRRGSEHGAVVDGDRERRLD